MTQRKFNFSPGPCTLPLEVLEETQRELVDYKQSGLSMVEMSHRGKTFGDVHAEAIGLMRELLKIPDEFSVMFIQGGATLQFAMTAMNLLNDSNKAGFVNSGHWAALAIADGSIYGDAYVAWDGSENKFTRMPGNDEIKLQPNTRYLHVTSNETIGGIQFKDLPDVGVPLVVDMSSDYCSKSVPWDRIDLTYGGVQKNLGPSGMAVVAVRTSVVEAIDNNLPTYLDYRVHLEGNSLFNTPPIFSIYVTGKILKWIKANGGVPAMEAAAQKKTGILYEAIEKSEGFYHSPVDPASRSKMNVVFTLPNEGLESKFFADAAKEGMVNLEGHRSVGGIRASIYNAMPIAGVETLVQFMAHFQSTHS